MDTFDVIVIGGGNAGLCAALAAAECEARVLLLERAPQELRGGNSFVTSGAFRFPYSGLDDIGELVRDRVLRTPEKIEIGRYGEEDFLSDLQRATQSRFDPALGRALVSQALPTMKWLRQSGVEFTLAYDRQSFFVEGVHRFWGGLIVKVRGEGPELVDTLYRACQRKRVTIQYGAHATGLQREPGGSWRVQTVVNERHWDFPGRAVVLACGGFEANAEMRAAHLGPRWKPVKVRGTPFNTGDGIRMALAAGAQPYGDWSGCHAVAWDINAPDVNTRREHQHYERDSYPLGIYVNTHGERFVDEGADFRNYTYARYGQEIMRQPRQIAFQIYDQKVVPLLKKPYTLSGTTRIEATTWREVARQAGIEERGLERTVAEYNGAVNHSVFNPAIKDGKAAPGLRPPKSNWAARLDAPPFVCFPVTCGITFTYGGLRVTPEAAVVDGDGRPMPGLFACGELMGGLFYHNYPGGSGLMAGAVFGRLAGSGAARGKAPAG